MPSKKGKGKAKKTPDPEYTPAPRKRAIKKVAREESEELDEPEETRQIEKNQDTPRYISVLEPEEYEPE